jgi:hypothetical protein
MSVLAFPRIHFRGTCLINPPTGNNNDVRINLDEANVALRPELVRLTDDEVRQWLFDTIPAVSPINGMEFPYLRSGWNPYGTGTVEFPNLIVCAAIAGPGKRVTNDPLIGLPVRIAGSDTFPAIICDVDPSASVASQLFVGKVSIGDPQVGLKALHDTRAHSRWVLYRNASVYTGEQNYVGAGATWQLAVPGNAIQFANHADSPTLAKLQAAVADHAGILLQFCFFLPQPSIPDADLSVLLRYGHPTQNPAEAFVVGTIGLWEAGELMTVPNGRLMVQPPADDAPAVAGLPLGPAVARVHADPPIVSLNLISTFPEASYDRPPNSKADLGPVWLGLIPAAGAPPLVIGGPLPYDFGSYIQTGGVLDVAYDPAFVTRRQLQAGSLVLLAEFDPGRPILSEAYSALTIESDDRAVYLDVDESGKIAVLVQERGGPPCQDVEVYLWEYQYVTEPGGYLQRATSTLLRCGPGTPRDHRLRFPRKVVFRRGEKTPLPIHVTALRPGALMVVFTFDNAPPEGPLPMGGTFYVAVRVMPQDDFSSVPADRRVSWAFMYETLFRYYNLIFPAMSTIIDFGNPEVIAQPEVARKLVAATEPKLWQTVHYMPPTRDLSTGKRKLLMEWAEHVISRAKPAAPGR